MKDTGSLLEKTSPRSVGAIETSLPVGLVYTLWLPLMLGALAGITKAFFKTSLAMPGHSVIWWFAPILAAKLVAGRQYSATLACLAAAAALAVFPGRKLTFWSGPAAFFAAGAVTDLLGAAVRFSSRKGFAFFLCAVAMAVAANLSRLLFKIVTHGPQWKFSLLGMSGRIGSYILFGIVTGAMVAGAFLLVGKDRKPRARPASDD